MFGGSALALAAMTGGALALDRLLGEPPRWHPVCGVGALAHWAERVARRCCVRTGAGLARPGVEEDAAVGERLAGVLGLGLTLVPWLGATGLFLMLGEAAGTAGGLGAGTVVLWLCLAPRALVEHGLAVAVELDAAESAAQAHLSSTATPPSTSREALSPQALDTASSPPLSPQTLDTAQAGQSASTQTLDTAQAGQSASTQTLGTAQAGQSASTQTLDAARVAVGRLVGRDTARLDAPAIARACVESLGENLVDGVLATLFWAFAGGMIGVAWTGWLTGANGAGDASAFASLGAALGAVTHRVLNVLDAMWGKRNARYRYFGTAAARLDDVLGWLPARLSLPCIALGTLWGSGASWRVLRRTLRVGWRFRAAHASPNSAWSEAAFAGALDLRLGGPLSYQGVAVAYPWLGEGRAEASAKDIRAAARLVWAGTLTTWLLLSGICSAVLS